MLVRWEGEGPPDKGGWIEVLQEALEAEGGSYWVRFYEAPQGWRFDLEHGEPSGPDGLVFKQADKSVALRVYERLVARGKPLDPGWMPLEDDAPVPAEQTRAADGPPSLPLFQEAGTRPSKSRRTSGVRSKPRVPPSPVETVPPPARAPSPTPEPRPARAPAIAAEPNEAGGGSSVLTSANSSEPAPIAPSSEEEPTTEARRLPDAGARWRRLRPAIVYGPAVLLVAFGAWLSWQRARPSASPPAPLPSPTANEEAQAAAKRLQELEAVVARLQEERARLASGRRSPTPASPGAEQRPPRQATRQRQGAGGAPAPAGAAPLPTEVQLPFDLPLSSATAPADEAVVPLAAAAAAAALPPAPPPPVQPGTLVDVNGPDVTPPVALTQTRPVYPPRALERRISGTVWLNALVDEMGRVAEVTLLRASMQGLGFEEAATRHVRSRLYRPATKQGVPVRVWVPIMVEFRLPGR